MNDEIQLISDDDGLMVVGEREMVERFLTSEGLTPSQNLGRSRLRLLFGSAAEAAKLGSEIAAESGRWVKLTKESAELIGRYGLRRNATTGLATGVLKGKHSQIKGFVEFVKGPGAGLTNPGFLSGLAGAMSQLAMEQTIAEITDYLAAISEKVDDVLRAQKDAAVAAMIGVDLVIEDAMVVRATVGQVSSVTWSRVQAAPMAIATTQAYALRQLDALAEKMEGKAKIGDLAKTAQEIESEIREWLAVLARCFQLQDEIAVLELDRVLSSTPDELDRHRVGLQIARQNRRELISRSTERLVTRMQAAAETANAKVLLHPTTSPDVVRSSNHVESGVMDFHERLGIERGRRELLARRWVDAVTDARDKAIEKGSEGADAARALRNEALDRAGSAAGRLSNGIAERMRRRRGNSDEG
ncbi:hypothetical protein [Actinacidiphila bryophytorum]|uniref:hypothetical protein n=1 Tax=Actinacidiphila bryophytorum TaxID=1436133 RepID=UPI002176E107|nr:hypothetical protein [Actinacidiphila bryophytorum]UWE07568.1 hypothetical protein NYE86_01660 [Actinacidiphila bryophytorum]